jgi:hypothetical protein
MPFSISLKAQIKIKHWPVQASASGDDFKVVLVLPRGTAQSSLYYGSMAPK